MLASWLNVFYPRGRDIFNENKHLSPLPPTGNHMTTVKNKNSLFLIPKTKQVVTPEYFSNDRVGREGGFVWNGDTGPVHFRQDLSYHLIANGTNLTACPCSR